MEEKKYDWKGKEERIEKVENSSKTWKLIAVFHAGISFEKRLSEIPELSHHREEKAQD